MKNNQAKKGRSTEDDIIIGHNLRKIRLLKGWSQEELGDFAGITFQQIQKYENGANRISAARLLKFSEALDVDCKVFYGLLIKENSSNHVDMLNPNILKIVQLLKNIENKKLLKEIESIVRSISKNINN